VYGTEILSVALADLQGGPKKLRQYCQLIDKKVLNLSVRLDFSSHLSVEEGSEYYRYNKLVYMYMQCHGLLGRRAHTGASHWRRCKYV